MATVARSSPPVTARPALAKIIEGQSAAAKGKQGQRTPRDRREITLRAGTRTTPHAVPASATGCARATAAQNRSQPSADNPYRGDARARW